MPPSQNLQLLPPNSDNCSVISNKNILIPNKYNGKQDFPKSPVIPCSPILYPQNNRKNSFYSISSNESNNFNSRIKDGLSDGEQEKILDLSSISNQGKNMFDLELNPSINSANNSFDEKLNIDLNKINGDNYTNNNI